MLSFAADEEDDYASVGATPNISGPSTPAPMMEEEVVRKKLGPNAAVGVVPKAITKASLLKEAQTREQLRKEYLLMQEEVKATEFIIPFTFFDGTSIEGGTVRVTKGDYVWFFLDKARRIGAEKFKEGGKRSWARISIDELMVVRGDLILPPVSSRHKQETPS